MRKPARARARRSVARAATRKAVAPQDLVFGVGATTIRVFCAVAELSVFQLVSWVHSSSWWLDEPLSVAFSAWQVELCALAQGRLCSPSSLAAAASSWNSWVVQAVSKPPKFSRRVYRIPLVRRRGSVQRHQHARTSRHSWKAARLQAYPPARLRLAY